MERMALNWQRDPDLAEEIKEVAHNAYHEHAEVCACRTVEHLTAFIALEVRDTIAARLATEEGGES